MLDFIIKYWVHFLFGMLVALCGTMYRKLLIKLKEQAAMKTGIRAIMQDRLYQGCTHFLDLGWIDLDSLKNMEELYESYQSLGGNGVGASLYQKIKDLDIKEKKPN
jgi:hypothetical protein